MEEDYLDPNNQTCVFREEAEQKPHASRWSRLKILVGLILVLPALVGVKQYQSKEIQHKRALIAAQDRQREQQRKRLEAELQGRQWPRYPLAGEQMIANLRGQWSSDRLAQPRERD